MFDIYLWILKGLVSQGKLLCIPTIVRVLRTLFAGRNQF